MLLQFKHHPVLDDLSSDDGIDEDLLRQNSPTLFNFTLKGIEKINAYHSCANKTCENKNLDDHGKCKCGAFYHDPNNNAPKSVVASLNVTQPPQNERRNITLFSENMHQLAAAYDIELDLTNDHAIDMQLVQLMVQYSNAVNFSCSLYGVDQLRVK